MVSEDTVQLFSTSTRDNAKLNVWRDSVSEVIFIRDHYIGDQKYVSSGYVSESPVDVAPLSIEEQRNLERRLRAFRGYARERIYVTLVVDRPFSGGSEGRMRKLSWH